VDQGTARRRVELARVARLGTRTTTGRLDLVPITFAFADELLVTAVDHKPKSTTQLKRLENVRANPEVAVLFDHYDDGDWDALWWVRVRGLARVVEEGDEHHRAVDALVAKYSQYDDRPPVGPAIVIEPIRWQWWSAS
jgi:PPOX class probable F420-dependent enzyme